VHPDVTWAGQHVGRFDDDPRVQDLRQAVVHVAAADNALNYSESDLLEVASADWLRTEARLTAEGISAGKMRLWEGPPSFGWMRPSE
jgi:hypothetical protein